MSNENKYNTPWSVDSESKSIDRVRSNDGETMGLFWKNERHIADLIAAAPEMLDVLQDFVKWETDYPVGHNPMRGMYAFNNIIAKATRIIRKAKGEAL